MYPKSLRISGSPRSDCGRNVRRNKHEGRDGFAGNVDLASSLTPEVEGPQSLRGLPRSILAAIFTDPAPASSLDSFVIQLVEQVGLLPVRLRLHRWIHLSFSQLRKSDLFGLI